MKFRGFAALLLTALLAGCAPVAEPAPETGAPLPRVTGSLKVYCFQAGKADAFLFWGENWSLLLDTGESGFGKTILAKLQALGIEKLDYLILSHFDKDHVGGAKKLLSSIPVGAILQSNCPKEGAGAYENYLETLAACALEPVTVRETLVFTLGDVRFTVDPPLQERYDQDPSNNSSLILTAEHGSTRLLFAGDAEDARLGEYLAGEPGPFDFVKLPHHGRYQSTLAELLDKTRPAWALITSSEEEPEDAETLALLEQRGIRILLTRDAPVLITGDGAALSVDYDEEN